MEICAEEEKYAEEVSAVEGEEYAEEEEECAAEGEECAAEEGGVAVY